MHRISLFIAAVLLVAGCNSNSVDFSIENPTDKVLKIQLDEATLEIPAHQAKDIALKAGQHSMDAPATGKISFIVYAERKGGIINPTLSDFVIVSESYVSDESKRKNFRPGGGGPFELDGVAFNGPYRLVNGLFIDTAWRFGVREAFPDSLRGYDPGNGGNIYSKIFTSPDFVRYVEAQSGKAGSFDKQRDPSKTAPRTVAMPAPLPVFADPEMQNASLPLRSFYERYLVAADPAQQKQLQGEYHKLIMDFTTVVASRRSKDPKEEYEKHGEFVRLTSEAMGRSAQVLKP